MDDRSDQVECDGGSTATSTRMLPWKSCALSAADTCELQKVIVKNRSETMKLSPRSFPTAKGWCFARPKCRLGSFRQNARRARLSSRQQCRRRLRTRGRDQNRRGDEREAGERRSGSNRTEQPQGAERERRRRKHEARALEPVKPSGGAGRAAVVSRCHVTRES